MRVIAFDKPEAIRLELEKIGVDDRAFPIFTGKNQVLVLKLYDLSCAHANVMKQLALTAGGDCAIHRDVIKGEKKISDAILFGTRRQLETVMTRMSEQALLRPLLEQIKHGLTCYEGRPALKFAGQTLAMDHTRVMGVINLTPDSFYQGSRHGEPAAIVEAALKMAEAGADFIDVGAQSTRPGSDMISAEDEIARLRPVLSRVVDKASLPVSVDTCKSAVARFAIDNGAVIINDVSALGFDPDMGEVIAGSDVGLVLMHMKGQPKSMQENPTYDNLMEDLHQYFQERIRRAQEYGIEPARLIVDPGLGFGKRLEDNYTIIRRLKEFKVFNRPILVGPSRKSFVGIPFGLPPEERLEGTLALSAILIEQGCNIIRVHDVLQAKRVSQLVDLVMNSGNGRG